MIEIVDKFEKIIYAALMAVLIVVLIAALLDLFAVVIVDLTSTVSPDNVAESVGLLDGKELIAVLGALLLVLIGIELLDTIKAYFKENTIHVEIVVLLAIIAIARKVILLDPGTMNGYEFGFELIGIGIIIAGLGAGYYMIKKAGITVGPREKSP